MTAKKITPLVGVRQWGKFVLDGGCEHFGCGHVLTLHDQGQGKCFGLGYGEVPCRCDGRYLRIGWGTVRLL